MATYKPDLVRKIVRLLESNHDGERAAAAGKLAAMAKEQKHNVDEMLAMVYGSGSLREASGARPRSSSWDDLWRRTEEATQRAEQAWRARQNAEAKAAADRATRQREREQADRATRQREREKAAGFKPDTTYTWAQGPNGSNRIFAEPILAELYALREKWSDRPLSEREAEFVEDVLNRGKDYRTTPAQDAWIRDIIQKYQRHAARRGNGDAESFWHS